MAKILFFFCVILDSIAIFAALPPIKRAERQEMHTSVAIPCCGKHFHHLRQLLQFYAEQTQLPDEIVISLSDVEKIKLEEINQLEQFQWPYILKIVKKQGEETAGGNRNTAAEHCTSEVILFQDADDIPHPQRVQIIKYFFENYQIDHLIHLWLHPRCQFENYIPEEIELIHHSSHLDHLNDIYMVVQGTQCQIHNGNISITRELSQQQKWKSSYRIGEDIEYNVVIYSQEYRTGILRAPLLIYRNEFSSYKNGYYTRSND